MLIGIGMMLLAVGGILRMYPPRKINWFYGYRTSSAMKNQDTWSEAQRLSSFGLIVLGLLSVTAGLGQLLISFPEAIEGAIIFLGLVGLVIYVEANLRMTFNKDGSRKSR